MRKVLIIKQPAGLGDLLWCHKIAAVHKKKGYEIVWPVAPSILQCNGKIKGVNFVDVTSDFEFKKIYSNGSEYHPYQKRGIKYLPLHQSGKARASKLIMKAKYLQAEMSHDDWQDYVDLDRDIEKEEKLFKGLGLTKDDKYTLINRNYKPWQGSAKVFRRKGYWPADQDCVGNFKVRSDLKKVRMSRVEGFSVFDWGLVIERATEVWTMDTCITLMMEVMDTSNINKLIMFCRHKNIRQINYMYKKNWTIEYLKGSNP